jgi:tetratricopeptide (TPR) repeat protein
MLLLWPVVLLGQAPKPLAQVATDPSLADVQHGDEFYRQGKFAEAEERYRSALRINPNLESAQAGLAFALLGQDKPFEAFTIIKPAYAAHPKSAPILVALGDASFRVGRMLQAEKAYLAALSFDPNNVRAYLGLFELYNAYSAFAHARQALNHAHDIDPSDPDVQLAWLSTLPRRQRVTALKQYLAASHATGGDQEKLQDYLRYLEKTADEPVHPCTLTGGSPETETKLKHIHDSDMETEGLGVDVQINNYSHVLLLDTGASGITINSKAAAKAGLQRATDIRLYGVGDQGPSGGYVAYADRIVISGLEFHDCAVTVTDKKVVPGIDGLIGADVFSSYLVDLDFQRKVLKLSALPKRPGDTSSTAALNSEGENENKLPAVDAPSNGPGEGLEPPRDRYIDPSMANWTPFFRFGHFILVPVRVNDSEPELFMVDTGAQSTLVSRRFAETIAAQVQKDNWAKVSGMNGKVKNVYTPGIVDLRFGRFEQPSADVVAIDLSKMSHDTGTEISGFLGFSVLGYLDIRIDYRDGLIDFARRDRHGKLH